MIGALLWGGGGPKYLYIESLCVCVWGGFEVCVYKYVCLAMRFVML